VSGTILDPCAGEGEALFTLRGLWSGRNGYRRPDVVACELEEGRALALRGRLDTSREYHSAAFHGDAFHLHWESGPHQGVGVLYLNPPYDTDPEFGRLEHRYLERFTAALYPGHGVLLFLVPVHALEASADYLAEHYQDLRCWRFPEPDYSVYSQVLLQGRRGRQARFSEHTAARIRAWTREPERLPVLPVSPDKADPLELTAPRYQQLHMPFTLGEIDLHTAVAAFRPFEGAPVGVHLPVRQLLGTRYAAAMPPKPTHVALAMASGVFNGHTLEPNRDATRTFDLPPLIAKGTFHRRRHHVTDRTNKKGEVTGSVEVEVPELGVTVQRLDTLECYTLRPLTEDDTPTGNDDFSQWTTADLIEHYSVALGRLLERQFPPMHRPGRASHRITLPELARQPFPVQGETVQAALKILAKGENPFLLAEVGVGKTTMALITLACLRPEHRAATVRQLEAQGFETARKLPTVRRALVMCPPHLVDTWEEEIEAVLPHARVKVLKGISDLPSSDEESDRPGADIFLLSREKAKLGHAFEGLKRCPRCDRPSTYSAKSNAAHRRRCPARISRPTNAPARLLEELATQLVPYLRCDAVLDHASRRMRSRFLHENPMPCPPHRLASMVDRAFGVLCAEAHLGDTGTVGNLAHTLCHLAQAAQLELPTAGRLRDFLRDEGERLTGPVRAKLRHYLQRLGEIPGMRDTVERSLTEALRVLANVATWSEPSPCHEPLFTARPKPRRVSLARYIAKRHRHLFDLLIIDEAHEYSHLASAQAKAAQRLMALPGVPTMILTGSLMNGYARSMFALLWALSPTFREEFQRTDEERFVDQYGYRKLFVPVREGAGEGGPRGTFTDRDLKGKIVGDAPGVHSGLILRHLLPAGLFVHKDDLGQDLPEVTELPEPVYAKGPELRDDPYAEQLLNEYHRLQEVLIRRIKQDRFSPKLAGRLLGQLVELPSYLDRATDDQPVMVLAYPPDSEDPDNDEEEEGAAASAKPVDPDGKPHGDIIAIGRQFPASWITPKERHLLDTLRRHLDAGEKTLLFLRHTGTSHLPRRLRRLIADELNARSIWLGAAKVPTDRRKRWIEEHVLEPEIPILLVNPAAVQTGLNNLTAFNHAIWYELAHTTTYRQANGRIDRLGQTRPVTIHVPYYTGTGQQTHFDLVAKKVSASLQVEGLDVRAALEAAGAGGGGESAAVVAQSLGEAMYRALVG
jgi:hypothetical protein